MKIASWNIAGCHKFNGTISDSLTYDKEDLGYFSNKLKQENLDFIGLQESLTSIQNPRERQADDLAVNLKMKVLGNQPYGKSHFKNSHSLSLSNLSTLEHIKTYFHLWPNPGVTVIRPNGDTWVCYDVGALVSEVKYENHIINLVNTHLTPFQYFNRDYKEPVFMAQRKDISEFLISLQPNPTIVTGDFNYANLELVFPMIFNNYQEAFKTETAPGKGQQDHILYSNHWKLESYEIQKHQADHYLCKVELSLSGGVFDKKQS